MKIKSKAVRRNICGHRLQEDEPVSANSAVVSESSVRYDPDGLGLGHSFLVTSGSVSNCVVNEGDQYEDLMDVDDGLVPDHLWNTFGSAPMRMTGEVVINEPDSSCEAGANRSQQLQGTSDYVGKGKGKVDDAPPLPSDAAVRMLPVYCDADPGAQGAVSSNAHVSFDVIAPHHERCSVSDYTFTMPTCVPPAESASSGCYSSFAAAAVSLNSGGPGTSAPVPFPVNIEPCEELTVSGTRYTVPLDMAAGCSANTSCAGAIGAHQPATAHRCLSFFGR